MKRAPLSQTAREVGSITASFAKVRILHCASDTPATAAAIAERLGRHGRPDEPAPMLATLVRRGLLRAKVSPADSARQYSLTPKGRHLLATATKYLQQLAATQLTKHK